MVALKILTAIQDRKQEIVLPKHNLLVRFRLFHGLPVGDGLSSLFPRPMKMLFQHLKLFSKAQNRFVHEEGDVFNGLNLFILCSAL